MEPDIFIITKLLSDPSRMHILDILMDGKAHTVNEIASFTKIKQHTVSYHLKLLTEAQVTTLQTYGRFHYYSLKSAAIVEMLEFLSFYSPQRDVKSYKQHIHKKELKVARTCYDHIAGELGISITNYLLQKNLLSESEKDFQLTEAGKSYFQRKLHIDTDELKKKKRKFCPKCLDWSERKNHVGGALGNALLEFFSEKQLVIPAQTPRSLTITEKGKEFLEKEWEI
ncbi:ArsR/SmtB family transcription factor [Streptococcus pneumoniae]|uniref:ArsR/SmtB family transcription factor n=1 Tax=Streptococcus pneumoniae TaxID=1313 RepID=UPI0007654751|nr:metalloregulator ArsR/SmtB family transcription factor [Streptococcus pneumoniae]CVL67249.1 ArsR family transcriptional regulator [Streptococcus pneumoniae]CVQ62574.1 ArsR family transcriptional regulator [Streptococcus pneumoniae]CVS17638.1 ArsR family transcriptional regulator [Streptococcus pneumoniae]CVZ68016.1 ArsR family transcriptional regulator [Streptococcus pneumoniae]HEV1961818.1 winged helix-turn-helix transcriptional regulator [Streptococcus pneumoniae]